MSEPTRSQQSDSDAAFLGWQQSITGEIVPLFNITVAAHPAYRSTVSDVTLRKMHLRIPEALSPYDATGPSPWHNLGIPLDHPATAREAIEIAGLDYTVVKRRLASSTGTKRDSYVMVRTDTGEVLGTVGQIYQPIQNRDAFSFFDTLVSEHKAVYETAGVLGLGERIWILAKLPGYIMVHGNDIVNKYLLLINSHDGSLPVRVKVMPIRVVCNNTLTSDFRGKGESQGSNSQVAREAVPLLTLTNSLYERLDVVFNDMANKKITEQELRTYIEILVRESEPDKDDLSAERIRNDVLQLHDSGRGAKLARGTLWGAFNSVTEYTDYRMLEGDPFNQLNSIWFGRGEQFKLKAFRLAEHMLKN